MADGEALLQAVLENPRDETVRLVYGDWLLERGDPRGELILLQCNKQRTAEQDRRIGELLAAHRTKWLGPLAEILDEDSIEFRRGFLFRGRVTHAGQRQLVGAVGAREWITVEELDFRESDGAAAFLPDLDVDTSSRLLLDPAMRSLRVIHGIDGRVLLTLCAGPRELPLEEIGVELGVFMTFQHFEAEHRWEVDEPEGAALAWERFPRLRRLTVVGSPGREPDIDWLFTGVLGERLARLRLDNWGGELGDYVAAAQHPTQLWRLEVRRFRDPGPADWVYTIERGDDRNLSSLRAELRVTPDGAQAVLLPQLMTALDGVDPGALTRIVVAMPRRLLEGERSLLGKARRFRRVQAIEQEVIPQPPSLRSGDGTGACPC